MGGRTQLSSGRGGMAVVMENIGKIIQGHNKTKESIPAGYRVGGFYYPKHLPAVLSVDYICRSNNDQMVVGVLEFYPTQYFTFRLGSTNREDNRIYNDYKKNMISGLSLGFGVHFLKYTFDFGSQNLGSAGWVSGITIGYTAF